MPRRTCTERDVLPDPIYNSKLVTRLINKTGGRQKRKGTKILGSI